MDVSMSSLFKRHGDKLVEEKSSFTHSPFYLPLAIRQEANRYGTPQGADGFAVSNLPGRVHTEASCSRLHGSNAED